MKESGQEFSIVEAHYHNQDLETSILDALAASGKDIHKLTPEDLAPFDEFHIRGRKATLELARELDLSASSRVLDVGSGIGGPSRCLATEFGCSVTGIDLCEEYCRVANMLAERLGLESSVSYHKGNAVDMPFEDATFDFLWTQHASMNIADKEALYHEMCRVLKPGGTLVLYDVLEGAGGPVYFPVPWAREPSASFLISPGQLRDMLERTGFDIAVWRDTTETSRSWFRHMEEKIRAEGTPLLGIHLLLGPDFRIMARNQIRNLEENRIAVFEVVARRPE